MDIRRSHPSRFWTKRRRIALIGCGLASAAIFAFLVPSTSAPSIERDALWIGTVRYGDMTREVRAPGLLVSRDFRWITAETPATVERILLRPGAKVRAGAIIMEMSNPALVDQKFAADAALRAAEAQIAAEQARLESEYLDRQADVATVQADYQQAKLQSEALTRALELGATSLVQQRTSVVVVDGQRRRLRIAEERAAAHRRASRAEIVAERARIDQLRSTAQLYARQVEALKVRAGIDGVLQESVVESGQQVAAGVNLARVAREGSLMAQLRVADTQVREVRIGQDVRIDLRDAQITGRVARIDPAVRSGTVLVDVELGDSLPRSARPDLSIDGGIRVERLGKVLHVERPANVQAGTTASLFRIDQDGKSAQRVQVKLGRGSVRDIEVVSGLRPGDRIVLSDTSQWAGNARVTLE